jgi:hypothetical protein
MRGCVTFGQNFEKGMIEKIFKIHNWFLVISAGCLIWFISNPTKAIEIPLHDTYFVIDFNLIALLLAVLFAFFSIAYTRRQARLNNWLGWLHLIFTVLPIFFISNWEYPFHKVGFQTAEIMADFNRTISFLKTALLVLLFGQLLFLINYFSKRLTIN